MKLFFPKYYKVQTIAITDHHKFEDEAFQKPKD
jgi:hypothetical protein